MLFLLKKIISGLLLPVPATLVLGLLGLLLLLTQKRKLAIVLWLMATLILAAFSFRYVPTALLTGLESQYHPLALPPAGVNTIVVLGGGVRGKTNAPPNTQLGSASLARLIEGLRLFHLAKQQGKHPLLILSGGRVFGSPSGAGKMQNTAVILGVNPKHIFIANGSQDTYQEARYLKTIVHQRRFILVTSAYHMPRAMDLFRAQGMHPIPAPTQYLARSARYNMSYFLPSAVNLLHADIALHEYLGILWARLSGKLTNLPTPTGMQHK